LFGNRNDTAMRTELIMFMTPHVITDDDESSDITERVKQQFKSLLDQSDVAAPRPTPR
jgi:type II secretory pathway component GspD/PulD (secretin)